MTFASRCSASPRQEWERPPGATSAMIYLGYCILSSFRKGKVGSRFALRRALHRTARHCSNCEEGMARFGVDPTYEQAALWCCVWPRANSARQRADATSDGSDHPIMPT